MENIHVNKYEEDRNAYEDIMMVHVDKMLSYEFTYSIDVRKGNVCKCTFC